MASTHLFWLIIMCFIDAAGVSITQSVVPKDKVIQAFKRLGDNRNDRK